MKQILYWIGGLVVGISAISALASPSTSTPTTVAPQQITSPSQSQPTLPVVEKKQETKEEILPFSTKTIDDSNLESGKTKLVQEGKDRKIIRHYEVTITDGKETDRKLTKEDRVEPVEKIIARGTRKVAPKPAPAAQPAPTSTCDPNYSGCVPIASDVDCAGGSGNGPAYVQGPIRVLGIDIYDLDRDNDGIACE